VSPPGKGALLYDVTGNNGTHLEGGGPVCTTAEQPRLISGNFAKYPQCAFGHLISKIVRVHVRQRGLATGGQGRATHILVTVERVQERHLSRLLGQCPRAVSSTPPGALGSSPRVGSLVFFAGLCGADETLVHVHTLAPAQRCPRAHPSISRRIAHARAQEASEMGGTATRRAETCREGALAAATLPCN